MQEEQVAIELEDNDETYILKLDNDRYLHIAGHEYTSDPGDESVTIHLWSEDSAEVLANGERAVNFKLVCKFYKGNVVVTAHRLTNQ